MNYYNNEQMPRIGDVMTIRHSDMPTATAVVIDVDDFHVQQPMWGNFTEDIQDGVKNCGASFYSPLKDVCEQAQRYNAQFLHQSKYHIQTPKQQQRQNQLRNGGHSYMPRNYEINGFNHNNTVHHTYSNEPRNYEINGFDHSNSIVHHNYPFHSAEHNKPGQYNLPSIQSKFGTSNNHNNNNNSNSNNKMNSSVSIDSKLFHPNSYENISDLVSSPLSLHPMTGSIDSPDRGHGSVEEFRFSDGMALPFCSNPNIQNRFQSNCSAFHTPMKATWNTPCKQTSTPYSKKNFQPNRTNGCSAFQPEAITSWNIPYSQIPPFRKSFPSKSYPVSSQNEPLMTSLNNYRINTLPSMANDERFWISSIMMSKKRRPSSDSHENSTGIGHSYENSTMGIENKHNDSNKVSKMSTSSKRLAVDRNQEQVENKNCNRSHSKIGFRSELAQKKTPFPVVSENPSVSKKLLEEKEHDMLCEHGSDSPKLVIDIEGEEEEENTDKSNEEQTRKRPRKQQKSFL